MGDNLKKLPALTEDNYSTWRERIKSILQQRKLWDAVDPGFEEDEDDDGNLPPRKQIRNSDALNLIKQATNDYTFHFIKRETKAKTAWDILARTFCDYSAIDVVDLLDSLFLLKKTDEMTMMQYIVKHEEIVEKLEEADVVFEDSIKGAMLLRGLPREEYKIFIMQFRVNDEQMSATNVKGKLLKEGRKEKLRQMMPEEKKNVKKEEESDQEDESQPKAYRTKHQQSSQSSYNSGKGGNSHYQKKSQSHQGNQDRPPLQCYFCDGHGHTMRFCQKFKEKRGMRAQTASYEEEPEKKREEPESQEGGAAKVVKFRALKAKKSKDPPLRNKLYEWVGDSGATHHMTPFKDILTDFDPNVIGTVEVADGEFVEAKGAGKVMMLVSEECGGWKLQLTEAIYVPDLDCNLISMIILDKKGLEIRIKSGILKVMDQETMVFSAKNMYGDAYILNCDGYEVGEKKIVQVKEEDLGEQGKFSRAKARRAVLWHDRLGHMKNLPPVCGTEKTPSVCDVCIQGKMQRKKFPLSTSRGEECLDLVHSDIVGKISPLTPGKCQYVATFLDDYSRYSEICLMKTKDETLGHFKSYVAASESALKKKVRNFQSDNGTEYRNADFKTFTQEKGILHRFSVVRTQQQNGRAENLNKVLFNITRCLLIKSGAPRYLWGEAVMYANEIRNRCPSKAIDCQIPYELWFEKNLIKEEIQRFKVFGCRVWSLITEESRAKLDARAEECIFVGHERGMKGFRLWSLNRQKILVARDVVFEETCFPFLNKITQEVTENPEELRIEDEPAELETEDNRPAEDNKREAEDDQEGLTGVGEDDAENFEQAVTSDKQAEETQKAVRRSERSRSKKHECQLGCCKKAQFATPVAPAPVKVEEIFERDDKEEWLVAMNQEMENHWSNQTWTIVPRPRSGNVVGSKWVFCTKTTEDGKIRYKARLVAQGFSQKFGVDYWETFSPVISKNSLRLLISTSIQKGWVIDHVDIVAAYLHGTLEETVFMEQPELWEVDSRQMVCHLKKSIYGLHQSGKAWNEVLVKHLKEIGLRQCVSDPCIFVHNDGCVGFYVDDLVLCGLPRFVKLVKRALGAKVQTKDLGAICNFIGIRFTRPSEESIFLDQSDYILETLREFEMLECKGAQCPGSTNLQDMIDCNQPFDDKKYRKAIGRLLYISTCTRPDISFMVSYLSKFCNQPTTAHWTGVKRVLRYLKQTVNYQLSYIKSKTDFPVAYSDSDYANDPVDSKSVGGYVIQMCGGAISWRSRKQSIVATCTMLAEYYAMYETCREIIWLRDLMSELNTGTGNPTDLYCDNQGAICLANGIKISERSKHCRMRYHYVRECVKNKEVNLIYVPTAANPADVLTKPLAGPKTLSCAIKMGLVSP